MIIIIMIIQVELELKPSSGLPSIVGRISISRLHVSGRCLFGLQLQRQGPGITAIDFSFAEQPHIQLDLEPFGMAITQLPGVHMLLKASPRLYAAAVEFAARGRPIGCSIRE